VISADLRALLARQKAKWLVLGVRPTSESEALLFPAAPDTPEVLMNPPAASARFREAADAYGLALRFHDLRHLHVSQLLTLLALPEVSKRAGHANPAVTAGLYAHALPGTEDRQVDAVVSMLRRSA
jgi:integrase